MRLKLRRGLAGSVVTTLVLAGSLLALPTPAVATTSSADTVYHWNEVLLELFRREGGGPAPLARAAAMTHAGIFDAFNNVEWSRTGGVGSGYNSYLGNFLSDDPFIAGNQVAGLVARDLLTDVFPDDSDFIQDSYDAHHGGVSAGSTEMAQTIVSLMRQRRANDGSADQTPYQFGGEPGAWQLTGPGCDSPTGSTGPVTPNWGRVKPFTMAPRQFRQNLPGGFITYEALLGSPLYAANLNEVKEIGRFDSATRTSEQEEIGWFWANDLDGTYKPVGQLLDATRTVAQERGVTDPRALARLFAHASLALADAGIAAWDQKYETTIDLWRPQTAIQLADTDGNAETQPDPAWLPLLADHPPSTTRINPCFPAWVSGHATFAAAWAAVMRGEFGDAANNLILTTEDPRAVGVQRTFVTYTQAAVENAESRLYLGVHYRFDAEDGLATGFGVGEHARTTRLTPVTCMPDPCW